MDGFDHEHNRQPDDVDSAELEMLKADPELAGMFIAEALDHLGSIEATVLALETSPGDVKLLNDLFRPFHTIKGNAGALGVVSVQALAHKVENLLDLGRSGKLAIGEDEIDAILKAVDVLTTMIGGLKLKLDGQVAPDVTAERDILITVVDAIVSGGPRPAPVVAQAPPPPPSTPIETPAAAVPDLSAPPMLDAGMAATPEPVAAAPVAPTSVAVQTPAAAENGAGRPVTTSVKMDTVKVDTRKLDNLVDMVGELVIVQAMIHEDPALRRNGDERLSRNLSQLKRITTDLQRNAMAMRMMPVRQTFQKMARLVRDLGKKSGKVVELDLSGEDTELDRQVVEDINDPLMHMVRNSVDHGIEDAGKRAAAGKPPHGRLSLSAYHHGGSIVIVVSDDGAGLNTERIRKKAIAQGLIGENDTLSDNEIHQLIFRPGFSTADKVTEISGRGVGMDVVRRNVDALRGRIDIQSTPGRGTSFMIKLPLTLAIVDGLMLRAAGERFVLPTFAVRESLRPKPEQVHCIQGRPHMIQVRNALLPLASLAELVGFAETPANPSDRVAVVIEDDGRRVALLVDELLGKQEVVIKSLGGTFARVRGVAGGAILGDGRVGLILDAAGLTDLVCHTSARAA
ncbi:MAG: chemotaxis protein CheA [Acidobacteria bacterium]|nr:chemotaxis protein CheA [Acidobacteriota bacterium]